MNALMFFLKGAAFIYAGQEHEIDVTHEPTLFDVDLVPWNKSNSIEPFIQRLAALKKQPIFIMEISMFITVKMLSYCHIHIKTNSC
jgi:cyclomaltodextrinase / maltogenic alpha-amylase / neopullulanase